ncbi:hypothetical protein PTKU46_80880 [Paraburkholderia terrae]
MTDPVSRGKTLATCTMSGSGQGMRVCSAAHPKAARPDQTPDFSIAMPAAEPDTAFGPHTGTRLADARIS